jgi:cobalamin biosynthesis protein CobW
VTIPAKIPATVITGFLGAGKTTLIRHLLANARGRRLALIINEFGDLGVDREILVGCGDAACADGDVIELANGCLCCTVADAFLPTLSMLIGRDQPPEHIVIETSGLALPKPLVKAFQWPEVRSRVTVDGVIAVIDAPAVASGRFADAPERVRAARRAIGAAEHDSPLQELYEDQLACADLVVLNKTDAVDRTTLARLEAELAGALPAAVKVVCTSHAALDPRIALGLATAAEDHIDVRVSHHDLDADAHDHDDFTSFVATLGPVTDPDALLARLAAVIAAHDILRVKGFVDVPGRPMRCLIQGVGGRLQRYFDRPWRPSEPRTGRLVVIGERGLDIDAILSALAAA